MKNNNHFRALLGVKQEDLALLLKVTRSQLAMYESGKRDLPVAAKLQLAEMLQHTQETQKHNVQNVTQFKNQEDAKKRVVAELVLLNQHNQLSLEKKIQVLQKKQEANFAKIRMAGYLEHQDSKKDTLEHHLLKSIGAKAQTDLEQKGWSILFQYQIQKEVLEAEAKLLDNYLQNLQ
jgi:transcriptional regulator with XRE-family HTH domain